MNPIVTFLKDLVYHGFEKFGRYYSKYRAFVVDNEDPEGMQRLKLAIPGIADNPLEEWAYGSNQFMGPNYGAQVLPQKGDMVWVTFEHGDPNVPIWEHGHAGENEIPKELRDPNIYWFRTPDGILLELDDTKKEVRVTDTFKNRLIMNKAGMLLGGPTLDKVQPGTLGNITEKILLAQSKGIGSAFAALTKGLDTMTGFAEELKKATTPQLLIPILQAQVPILKKANTDNKKEVDDANKSIIDTNKIIPNIKSKNIKIHE